MPTKDSKERAALSVGRLRGENYYLAGEAHGEPAGIWWGKGAKGLGLAGEVRHQDMETTYGDMSHPVTGEALGQAPRHFASFEERVARLLAREGGDVTPERRQELELVARKNHREARHHFDLTFSPSKSWSVPHASLERQ